MKFFTSASVRFIVPGSEIYRERVVEQFRIVHVDHLVRHPLDVECRGLPGERIDVPLGLGIIVFPAAYAPRPSVGGVSEPDEHEFGLGWFVRFVDHRVPIAEVPLFLEETRTPEPNEREQDDPG